MANNTTTFDLFGDPNPKQDIRVGYISTDRGYVEGLNICQANLHAKNNPGETFIFKPDRKTVKFLSINEVNKLEFSGIGSNTAGIDSSCPDGLKMDAPPSGAKAVFMGGGGVGVVANPVIGDDGAVLAVDVVHHGFGYQYPPIVEIRDDSGIGVGAVTRAVMGKVQEEMIYYDREDEFEDIQICPPNTLGNDGGKDITGKKSRFGRRWGPDGKDLGPWVPEAFTGDKKAEFEDVVDEYIKQLNESGKDWWTTRKNRPNLVTGNGSSTEVYKVDHWKWGGTNTPYAEVPFEIHWHSPHRTKGLGFEFVAEDGSHSFRIVDSSRKNDGSRTDVYKVKENITYKVRPIGQRSAQKGTINDKWGDNSKVVELAEQGLLRKMRSNKEIGGMKEVNKLDANKVGTGDKIFADFLDTLDDNDDIQVQAGKGKFTASNQRWVQSLNKKRRTYDLTYRLQTGREVTPAGFMNTYAISPVPKSNVKGSDHAGEWYTFEWDIEFPYDGKYIFHTARDDKSKVYIDNVSYTDKLKTFTGTELLSGKAGSKRGQNTALEMTKGTKTLKLEVYNEPQMDKVADQQPSLVSSSKSVTFNISSSADFANSIRIDELDILESKTHKGPQINAKITKDIEFGRKYKVVLNSPQSTAGVRLRVKDQTILEMEEHTDNDWKDIVCSVSAGQFTDINKNIAYFSVPHPKTNNGNQGKSTSSKDQQVRKIFNTVDYINRANRVLWRTNVYKRGGFLNEYGICPFDTKKQLKDNPYAGTHNIVWPGVNFPIDGNYSIELEVDDSVKLTIGDEVTIDRKGFLGDTNVGTGKLKLSRYIKQGNYNITAELYQKPGGSFSFKGPTGKVVQMMDVSFNVSTAAAFGNKITIPGLFSVGKKLNGGQINQTITKQAEVGKEYDVIVTTVRKESIGETGRDVKLRERENGRKLQVEEWTDADWQDVQCLSNKGEFYNIQGNRCKFRVGETVKGINPMALAINIEAEFGEKEIQAQKSWNENPMGVAMTIEAPPPPIPQEPIPLQEGRCPNNPFWTTRFPGGKEQWYPVKFKGWGNLLNKYGISPLPPLDQHNNKLVKVPFEIYWHSPHRTKGLGYRFTAQDGSHSFDIVDNSKLNDGQRTENIQVKENTVYDVKAIGQRTHAQGSKIGKTKLLGKHDNSKVVELAEQGLLKKIGVGGLQERKVNKLDANREGTGDKIFADFLDTLDDSDDVQIQAGVGKFTASNRREVFSLRGTRVTFDLTYRVTKVPPNDTGSFSNTWTKNFPYGGYYKILMEADDIGELWIDDEKVIDLDRRKGKTDDQKLVYIPGPDLREDPNAVPISHDIKVVVENFKSERKSEIDAKVFNTRDWIGGGSVKAEVKKVNFRITSAAEFANGIKIPDLGIDSNKRYKGPQLNEKFVRDVEVNKVYEVEVTSTQSREGVKLRTKGESVLEMEEHSDNDWKDIQCSATEGRFFDFIPGPNKATCKYMVSATTTVAGGIRGGTTKSGVTYQGPHLFHYTDSRWGKIINREGVSPIGSPTQSLSEFNDNIFGKKILTWKNVNFPQTGKYDITFLADNTADLFIDDKKVLSAPDNYGQNEYNPTKVDIGKGKHNIRVELTNALPGGNVFLNNPTGVALNITYKMTVGTGTYKSWKENPMGVSAKIIPPPCPKKIEGEGIIPEVIVDDPGNGYPPGDGGGYPAALRVKDIIVKNPGIGYDCSKDKIRLVPDNGAKLSLCQCAPFGRVEKVCVDSPGVGFTRMPNVVIDTDTGVNLDIAIQFEVIRDPLIEAPLVQVTDLVGLKQTGYYNGRPYYGAVFFQDGVKYAGWYETAGELVQIYDTMQESIDAEVTTPPSAILRQGSDVSSNDPRLNIPGTPENLT